MNPKRVDKIRKEATERLNKDALMQSRIEPLIMDKTKLNKKVRTESSKANDAGANFGYEAQLWQMADALRGSMDAAEYKHVVLGLIFLKYISDAFEEHHAMLETQSADGHDSEDPDEYRAENIFWVPLEARWVQLKNKAKQPVIGQLVDDAMAGIERDNPVLKGVLPKDYGRPHLDKQRLGQLIDLISNIKIGDTESRSEDVLGRVYEYFLSQFASAEGKKGGEFYTPRPKFNHLLPVEMQELLVAKPSLEAHSEIRGTLSPELLTLPDRLVKCLSFSHFAEIISIADPLKRTFYEAECIRSNWSVRELKRQIASLYFERSGLSTNKAKLAAMVKASAEVSEPSLAVRDPYIFG